MAETNPATIEMMSRPNDMEEASVSDVDRYSYGHDNRIFPKSVGGSPGPGNRLARTQSHPATRR
jgi:hypothetical protein